MALRLRRLRTPSLDFLVIGAEKAGTTSLWRYLEDHPRLVMPPDKEASFFSEPAPHYPDQLRPVMMALFKDAPRDRLLGKVTPAYMTGTDGVSVPTIAGRIRESMPRVRLVALLRDPAERAYSAHRMRVAYGQESRSFAEAVDDLLAPDALERARRGAGPRDAYIVGSEYGRMLAAYRACFPAEQVHVELTEDLERGPADVVGRVCRFIGVEPHEPARLGERHNVSGRARVSSAAEAELKTYLERNVWPRLRHAGQHRNSFEQWFLYWNSEPGLPAPAPPIDVRTAARLREHFADDARLLADVLGREVPWARPDAAPTAHRTP